ncbi:HipA family kinase [Hymenobacter aerophilus]|uniref:HipA family kinase n=1 Tax=Hymenobacter aerophilus TaxID=119644 RepID=UPI00037DFB26|nr:HipA family kinase [Hymenobacter aerophilus]
MPGGGTRPWAVRVQEGPGGKLSPFVVKLFKASHLDQHPHLAAEVFGSVLADMFDLPRPDPALIEFSPAFRDTLNEPQQQQLAETAPGLLFGCRLVEGPYAYSRSLPLKKLEEYDMETIYGFDNLILNTDRRPNKPNLLMTNDEEAVLIDHELSLSGIARALSNLSAGYWEHLYQQHLFYAPLKARGPAATAAAFNTFTEYLRGLNPALLLPYHHQLADLNCSLPDFDLFLDYLRYQKANAGQFQTLLRQTLV